MRLHYANVGELTQLVLFRTQRTRVAEVPMGFYRKIFATIELWGVKFA